MIKDKIANKESLLKQFAKMDEYYANDKYIPYEEVRKTLSVIAKASEKAEGDYIYHVASLDVKHNCYHALQRGYRIISEESSYALLNSPTDDNLAIIMVQFGTLCILEEYLKDEKAISLAILNEMSDRTVKRISESAKTFKKINGIKSR